MSIYNFHVKNSLGDEVSMSDYEGKMLLIVNVASECGLTNQYEGLEGIYEDYKSKDFEILGFPCNQFGGQEPGTDAEIQKFCQSRFGIKFPIFKKIEVNGVNTHPLFEYLKSEAPGLLGSKMIKWNFTKFLIGKDGSVLKRFGPREDPASIRVELEKIL